MVLKYFEGFAVDPFALFLDLMRKAEETERYPTAMNLATVNTQTLMPRSRMVLLNRLTADNRLEFFSNYLSAKAKDLDVNPQACANFFWPEMYYQVIFQGAIVKVDAAISDAYFQKRTKEKQVATLSSSQSQAISSYQALIHDYHESMKKYQNQAVPRPHHWGGYHLIPQRVEFWRGSQVRLHERREFTLTENNLWHERVLGP